MGKPADQDKMQDKKTLIEDAYDGIKEMIFQQKLIPSQKLVYNDLSRVLKMSRTPIINALNRLELEGFVVSERFRGFHVKPIDIQEAWDLFGVREALEAYAVEHVIKKADVGEMKHLEEKLAKHEAYKPEVYDRKRTFLDAEFHVQMADMTNNMVLKKQVKANLEHFYIRFKFDNYDLDRLQTSVEEHHRLLGRIKKKDIKGSVEAIRTHVRNARDHIIRALSSEEDYHQIEEL
ncbi:MAG: GntR family transcriptional regulator [Proteobacteria bacterium]|nr:GntR family transcriptional regulator [Pseudomonadota bacterium]